ncbi:hypothetical protein AB3S75_033127 [Citrus x aurantiifolia]
MVATWDDSDEETSDDDDQQEMTNLALMAVGEESFDELDEVLKKKKNKWYLDSGCSGHMAGNYSWFSSFTKIENGGDVSFGNNSKGKIIGIGNVEEEQQEASNDNQEDAPHGIQEEHHEETNAEQNESTSQTLPNEWRNPLIKEEKGTEAATKKSGRQFTFLQFFFLGHLYNINN